MNSADGSTPFKVTVDVGGTFTDVVLSTEDGALYSAKAPTTPAAAFDGVSLALALIAQRLGISLDQLIGTVRVLIYGTTRATNALLERKTSKTAFFTTAGFPDVLRLREGGKHGPFDYEVRNNPPLIPRELTFEIGGRINAAGEELQALDLTSVRDAIERSKEAGSEAVAVCLIWSVANSAHELEVGEELRSVAPELAVTLSHQLNPIPREYRRASASAIDASLKPLMSHHLSELERELLDAGFAGKLYVVGSSGGCLPVEEAVERPIHLVNSGPSMAPVAARSYSLPEDGANIIVCDTGGTSFDVSLVRGGVIPMKRDVWLGETFTGDIVGVPSVDVSSVGAGGGSIAWVDKGGLVRVGPESAGAVPGPACYARGGTRPTLTDAAVVLGYLAPEKFLEGRLVIEAGRATAAIEEHVASKIGLSVPDAAWAVFQIAAQQMVSAIRHTTVSQGIDPRDGVLLAGGGAGGLNAVEIARSLQIRKVVIPRVAPVLSAAGAQFSDIVIEAAARNLVRSDAFDHEATAAATSRIDETLMAAKQGLAGIKEFRQRYLVEARYPGQVWDVDVDIESWPTDGEDVAALEQAFHREHRQRFAVADPTQPVECQMWRAQLIAELPRPNKVAVNRTVVAEEAPDDGHRRAYFGDGFTEAKTLAMGAEALRSGVAGPLILTGNSTTIVVPPAATAFEDDSGRLTIEVDR